MKRKIQPQLRCPSALSRKQHGFSLIEIAIVLIIVGVLAGAVVKGMQFIEDARQSNAERSLQSIGMAYQTYIRRFLAPPGDDRLATSRFTAVTNGDGNARIEKGELPWQHLRAAELITGSGSDAPNHPWGGSYRLLYHADFARNALCMEAVGGDRAQTLDRSLDDGLPASGSLRIDAQDTAYNKTRAYTICTPL